MLRLFQVGNVRLYSHFASDSRFDYTVARKIESPTEVTNLIWSPKKVVGYGGYNLKAGRFSYTELLLSTEIETMEQRYNRYNSLTSLPYVDLFAYRYASELDSELRTNKQRAFDAGLVWYHTTGTVKSIDPKPEDNKMTVEIDVQTEWESINRFVWKFTPYLTSFITVDPAAEPKDDLESLPMTGDLQRRGWNGYWSKKFFSDPLYFYDPSTWGVWHLYRPVGYPQTGLGSDWTGVYSYSFTLSQEDWGGLTRSLYQFKNLPTSGGLEIAVTSQRTLYGTRTFSNVLSLSSLNQDLQDRGLGGLLTTDRLVIDDYQGYRSFIIRDTAILSGVNPKWVYNGEILGQTDKGLNIVTVIPPNEDVEIAYLHNFRTI